tara:strand:- start:3829 stop:4263 length:435 start_codon:yes stop_codon:yes gene_type:complete
MNQTERKYLIDRVDKISLGLNSQLNGELGKHWSIKNATVTAITKGEVKIQKDYKEIIIDKIMNGHSYGLNGIGSIDIVDLLDGFVKLKDKVDQHNDAKDDKIKIARQKLGMETDRLRDIMAMDQELTQESAVSYLQDFEKYILL